MANRQYFLSKSKYMDSLRCPKLLWCEYNNKSILPAEDESSKDVIEQGMLVESFARKLFPDGITIEREHSPVKQLQKTRDAMKSRKPLFGAGFQYKELYALADILNPVGKDEWDLYEVKSSTEAKPEHITDVAFQKYVYEKADVKIRHCYLMHINNEYVRKGEINPKQLFTSKDITEKCAGLFPSIEAGIKIAVKVINAKAEPKVNIGFHCGNPWGCPLTEKCWSFLPEKDSVYSLYRGKSLALELISKGILKITDIPKNVTLKGVQPIQYTSHKNKEIHIDKPQIKLFLESLVFPLYLLDFETINPAIPVYDNSHPYDTIPFQYSLYRWDSLKDEPIKFGYIEQSKNDPRGQILKQLKELLGQSGSVIAYNDSFEKNAIKNAAAVYDEYKDWAEVLEGRFIDLLVPFRSFYYYNPVQEGSASLKQVLPALTKMNYKNIAISNGGEASGEYFRVTFGEDIAEKDRKAVYKALDKYCDIDTIGMAEIIKALAKISK